MKKFKNVATRVAAFSMATLLTCSGVFDNITLLSKNITGNVLGMTEAQAATKGTVNADVFSWDNATVYFLLTDRFKNGDTSNDHSYNRGLDKNGNVISGIDERGTFHGGDFKGITQTIEDGYFNDLGVNALWISAPYEQIHGYIVGGDGSPSFAHYSYHGYYVLDYTNTDANFGTEEDFKELVDTAHKHGIRVVMDIVLNHAGYNSLYDMNEYDFGVVKDGWDDYYFSMSNVNNKDYHSYIDYEGSTTQWGKWWGSWVRAGLPGYTEGGNSSYTMSLSGLPDFKTESTSTVEIPVFLAKKWKEEGRYDKEVSELKNYLSSHGYQMTVTNCISYWLSSWVRDYGVDGFRCDTAKHVEYSSWKTLKNMCTDALKEWKANNPDKKLDDLDFWMTGECWNHGVSYDGYYTDGGFDSMINFDTTGAGVLSLGTVGGKYNDYAGAINTKDDFNVLSYISSHDSTLARGDMVYLGSAFLLLPGGVQIYYGDETNRPLVDGIDFDGNGGAGHSLRSDMNWDSMDEEVLAHWQKVGTFRNSHIAVGAGTNTSVDVASGVAFVRTYSKGNVSDRVAACIGASANTQVTIDVSEAWSDGETVVNYYDSSSAVVTGGKVTFNSGANGTILIADPDGKPLVTVSGDAKFKGTQTVKVGIKDADYAIISVDGAKKFKVNTGDTFTIGETAYEGDTVTVSYKATNDKGTMNGKATFYKAYADEDISGGSSGNNDNKDTQAIVHVKMSDGSAPYLYSWDNNKKNFSGVWPGTKMTEKDLQGYYIATLDTTSAYNVIFNNGSGTQTDDIAGLKGEVWIDVAAGFGSYTVSGDDYEEEVVDNVITIHVKPYGSTAPNLYVWDGAGKAYNGGFPGKQLTEKDDAGFYVFTANASSVNCIISNGSNQNQSGNITGISGEAWITMTASDNSKYDVEKTAKVESKFSLMKAAARSVKNMTSSDYTSDTWSKLYSYVAEADKLVAQGEKEADADAVNTMYNNILAAKNALVLATPKVTNAAVGNKVVKGTAPREATVTVTIGSEKYTATADEITGVWSITANSNLTGSNIITMSATRKGLSSASNSYNMSNGNVDNPVTEDLTVSLKSDITSANVGKQINLSAQALGGSAPYTYSYLVYNNETGVWFRFSDFKTDSKLSWNASSAGNRAFYVEVKDGSGKVVRSSAVNISVTGTTDTLSVTAKSNASSAAKGAKVTITATAAGGTGSYKYSYIIYNKSTNLWFRLADKVSQTTYTWTASDAGNRIFYVDVTDGAGKTVRSNGVSVDVTGTSALTVTGTTSSSDVKAGDTVILKASANGGNSSYKYSYIVYNKTTNEWFRLADKVSSNSYLWKASSAGNRVFYIDVTDGTGKTVRSNAINVNVTATSASTFSVAGSINSSSVSVGSAVTIKGIATGQTGSCTYSFLVYNEKTGEWYRFGTFAATNELTWKASSAGNRKFYVESKDSTGKVVRSAAVTVTVK